MFYIRTIAKYCGLTRDDYWFEACGDDTFIIIRRDRAQKFIDTAYKYVYVKDVSFKGKFGLGQIAKMFERSDNKITGVEYLSQFFVENEYNQIALFRKEDRLFQGISFTMNNKKKKIKARDALNKGLLLAEAMNLESSCHDLVHIKELIKCYRRVTDGSKPCFKDDNIYVNRQDTRHLSMNSAYRLMMEEKYGILDTDFDDLISKISSVKHIYDSYHSDYIDKLERVDSLQVNRCYDKLVAKTPKIRDIGKNGRMELFEDHDECMFV